AYCLRIHLQLLAQRTRSIYSRSHPSNAGTKHLVLFFAFFREAVRFFYVFYIPAVFLGGERYAFFGVADGADAVGMDVDIFGVG
ncbi:MAG TPA: hypothetical protein VK638_27795, partial [Edaphobacter sp.]|nr:hypothetical protein [Edaphobacter sp.]